MDNQDRANKREEESPSVLFKVTRPLDALGTAPHLPQRTNVTSDRNNARHIPYEGTVCPAPTE